MLNEQMNAVAIAIEQIITHTLPLNYQAFLFSGRITMRDIIGQVLVECCKYAHDSTAEKHSLYSYLQSDMVSADPDAARMVKKRVLEYIQDRRDIEYQMYLAQGLQINGLHQEPEEGWKLNSFQYWEINNVHDMHLVKAIVDRRISKKNFSTEAFKEDALEYDGFLQKLHDEWLQSNDNAVFDYLAMFTLEWKYSFDFFYELATEMVKTRISQIPDCSRRLCAFCGRPTIISRLLAYEPRLLEGPLTAESRLLLLRRKYIHDIVVTSKSEFADDFERFVECIAVVADILLHMTFRKQPIREWFVKNSTQLDWISVFREYDVFESHEFTKDWNLKKIRAMKQLYDTVSFDYKNPVFRS